MQARSAWSSIAAAVVGCAIGVVLRVTDWHPSPPLEALLAGLSILSAAFLLMWASDASQADISRSLSLAFVALIAVLPEYAVDMYFTWQAGRHPETGYAVYAVANMTGANRLLLGLGWSLICFVAWLKKTHPVVLEPNQRTEVLFLGLATAYAFLIPLKGSLMWYDGLVLVGLYGWYIYLASQKPCGESVEEGPAAILMQLPTVKRRLVTSALFLVAGSAIFASAEPFCEGLVHSGKLLHIDEFFLVQWLAPVASETPEFLMALLFAMRGRPELAIATLLSSKLNQWTLLVGMIPWVYALAHRGLETAIPFNALQMHEILLTAAQSLLGVVILANLSFSVGEAFILFVLFVAQFVSPLFTAPNGQWLFGVPGDMVHPLFSVAYVLVALVIVMREPRIVGNLRWGANVAHTRRGGWVEKDSPEVIKTHECRTCRWRLEALEREETRHPRS